MAEQQIGNIIDFASTKSNINKDLKMALLRLYKSMDDAKQDYVRLMKTTKSTQTEAFAFAGSSKGVADATAREELSGGARKAKGY